MNASRYTWRHHGDARPCPDTVPATGNPLVAQRTTYPNTQIPPLPAPARRELAGRRESLLSLGAAGRGALLCRRLPRASSLCCRARASSRAPGWGPAAFSLHRSKRHEHAGRHV